MQGITFMPDQQKVSFSVTITFNVLISVYCNGEVEVSFLIKLFF